MPATPVPLLENAVSVPLPDNAETVLLLESAAAVPLLEHAAVVAALECTAAGFAALTSDALTAAVTAVGVLRRDLDRYAALAAAEVAHRSRHEYGHSGLAQKAGFVNPTAMIQSLARIGRQEASRLIGTGTLIADTQHAATLAAADDGAADSSGADPSDADPSGTDAAGTGEAGSGSGSIGAALVPVWSERLVRAATTGALSLDVVDAIRRVFSEITGVHDTVLTDAVHDVIDIAADLSPEQVHRYARQLRDRIDTTGIQTREKHHHELRSMRTWWDGAGMHCGTWRLPPEDGTLIAETFDQILSPRRGGPRFIDPTEQSRAAASTADPRSDEQITADALVDLIQIAVDTDPHTLLGTQRPAVRIVITADHLRAHAAQHAARTDAAAHPTSGSTETGSSTFHITRTIDPGSPATTAAPTASSAATDPITAPDPSTTRPTPGPLFGWIEGRGDTVSAATVERHLCNAGAISIGFDQDGQCVNVGRTHRLFTHRQRTALAIRDGGCRYPGCDRPPSWCEAHHITPWTTHNGRTDIADGILLCRRHHLLLHTNHWTITRTGADYQLHPPADIDPTQTPIPMPSKSPTASYLRRRQRTA